VRLPDGTRKERTPVEFIIVRFSDPRDVFVDGMQMGETDEKLRVQAGVHTIDLGNPRDYIPNEYVLDVQDTASLAPLEVRFVPT
jgi:hypothetical protein